MNTYIKFIIIYICHIYHNFKFIIDEKIDRLYYISTEENFNFEKKIITNIFGRTNYYIIDESVNNKYIYMKLQIEDYGTKSPTSKFIIICKNNLTIYEIIIIDEQKKDVFIKDYHIHENIVIFQLYVNIIFLFDIETKIINKKGFEDSVEIISIQYYFTNNTAVLLYFDDLLITNDLGRNWNEIISNVVVFAWSIKNKVLYFCKDNHIILYNENNKQIILYKSNEFKCIELLLVGDTNFAICHDDDNSYQLNLLNGTNVKRAKFPFNLHIFKIKVAYVTGNIVYIIVENIHKPRILMSANINEFSFDLLLENFNSYKSEPNQIDCILFSDLLPHIIISEKVIEGVHKILITYNGGRIWYEMTLSMLHLEKECKNHDCNFMLNLGDSEFDDEKSIIRDKKEYLLVFSINIANRSEKNIFRLYFSTDGGYSWKMLQPSLYNPLNYMIRFIDHQRIILLTKYNQLWYSEDGGDNWTFINIPYNNFKIKYIGYYDEYFSNSFYSIIFDDQLKRWTLIQISSNNYTNKTCENNQYEYFHPRYYYSDECYLGEKNIYYKKIKNQHCLPSYLNRTQNIIDICQCTIHDFKCNQGYYLDKNSCKKDLNNKLKKLVCESGKMISGNIKLFKNDMTKCKLDQKLKLKSITKICDLEENINIITILTHNKLKFTLGPIFDKLYDIPIQIPEDFKIISYDLDLSTGCAFLLSNNNIIVRSCWSGKKYINNFQKKLPKTNKLISIAFYSLEDVLFVASHHEIYILSTKRLFYKKIFECTFQIIKFEYHSYLEHISIYSKENDTTNNFIIMDMSGNMKYKININDKMICAIYNLSTNRFLIYSSNNLYVYDLWNILHEYNENKEKNLLNCIVYNKTTIFVFRDYIKYNEKNINFNEEISIVKSHYILKYNSYPCYYKQCQYMCFINNGSFQCSCPENMIKINDIGCQCNGTDNNCQICKENEFKCDKFHCISSFDKCDGFIDCDDLSDELNCEDEQITSEKITRLELETSKPKLEKFILCMNNEKINKTYYCDGYIDCRDGSDEYKCQCFAGFTRCHYRGECIPNDKTCDSNIDCYDKSDESSCEIPYKKENCVLYCENKCIDKSLICNKFTDCISGSDEVNCNYTFECQNDSYMPCLYGYKCYNSNERCDGYRDCMDGSDELNCNESIKPLIYDQEYFKCNSSQKYINLNKVCNGIHDCEDHSDELLNCVKNRITMVHINIIDNKYALLSWNTKIPHSDYTFTILLKNKLKVDKYVTNKRTILFTNLKYCTTYKSFIYIESLYDGQFIEFNINHLYFIPPTSTNYNYTSNDLTWNYKIDKCIPFIYHIECFINDKSKLRIFSKENKLKTKELYHHCMISVCPMNVYNISCSENIFIYTKSYSHISTNYIYILIAIIILVIGVCIFMKYHIKYTFFIHIKQNKIIKNIESNMSVSFN